jgi:beta-glucosidase
MAEATLHFPPDFLWGTATSAHQVEGDNQNNDWWAWEQRGEGRIYADQRSGKACDWWAGRAEEDIERMAALHTNAHRLSVEWSRIEPKPGEWDHHALDRYRTILKAMRQAGIKPMVTLHHFTNPIWMAERGGWQHPDSVGWFQNYARKVAADLLDLCDTWCTINEPNIYAAQGYFNGRWPPGVQSTGSRDSECYFQVVYHLIQAHAAAYEAIHDMQPDARVGLAKSLIAWRPLRPASPLDRALANLLDRAFNGLTLDALATGSWRPLQGRKAELPQVKNTLDWIGLNYYTRQEVHFSPRVLASFEAAYGPRPDQPSGPGDWGELYPEGLFEMLRRLYKQFRLPIAITETGVPDEDDSARPGWILETLRWTWKAVTSNWPVMGYYFWSLLDNFEWAEGYDPRYRFGLYEVDFSTQERTLRRSGDLYAQIAETGTISSKMTAEYAPALLDKLFPGEGP